MLQHSGAVTVGRPEQTTTSAGLGELSGRSRASRHFDVQSTGHASVDISHDQRAGACDRGVGPPHAPLSPATPEQIVAPRPPPSVKNASSWDVTSGGWVLHPRHRLLAGNQGASALSVARPGTPPPLTSNDAEVLYLPLAELERDRAGEPSALACQRGTGGAAALAYWYASFRLILHGLVLTVRCRSPRLTERRGRVAAAPPACRRHRPAPIWRPTHRPGGRRTQHDTTI